VHLQNLWERVAQAEYDKLGAGLAYDDYLAVMGAYQACRRNMEIVDTLIAKAQELNERTERDTESRRNQRDALFTSSPYHGR
jgi:hypothetical protein